MSLSREASLVQNPALGAVLLWRFALGFQEEHKTADAPPLPLMFIVLPLVLHSDTFEHLSGTRAGLRAFVDKFAEAKSPGADLALAVHERALSWRPMSLAALRLGLRTRLIAVDSKQGRVFALSTAKPAAAAYGDVKGLIAAAEKLGRWCAELSLFEVGSVLKVVF